MRSSRRCTVPTTHAAKRVLFWGTLLLAASAVAEFGEDQVNERMRQLFPERVPDQIHRSPVPGLYEVFYGTDIFYVTDDGRHILDGDIYDADQKINLTETSRAKLRASFLNSYSTDKMVVFPASASHQHTLVVVTDIDCPYCRKFHEHIEEFNAAGVEIRYLLYPRAGEGSDSYHTSVDVWCSEDRQDALTRAKRLETIPSKTCANPITEHIDLVNHIGIRSTPSIFLSDGTLVRGYRPPSEILGLLGG